MGANDPAAPQPALASELEQVSRSAAELRAALARPQHALPAGFPRDELDAIAITLELAPQMSAEGALHALTYARPKLSRIRRRSLPIGDAEGDLPDVPRGGFLDRAMALLIADVGTAREWYGDTVLAEAEDSAFPETASISPAPALRDLAARAHHAADAAGEIADELRDGASPGSVHADNLHRRIRDMAVLSRQEGIELAAERPRPRLIDQLNRALASIVPWIQMGLKAVEIAADFAIISLERFSNIATRQITVICEEVGGFARDTRALLDRHQRAAGRVQPPAAPRAIADFTVFRDVDAPWCPEMVMLPAGTFLMGSPETEERHHEGEGPQHRVTIGHRFALGRYPVTFEEYDHFCDATKREKPSDEGWGRSRRPVINVFWDDAVAYCEWLSQATGQRYRLPTEAEWEYACRAGTATRYSWGDAITPLNANYEESKHGKTTEVGAYPANPWGLYDLHGNVWEWCADGRRTYTAEPVTDPVEPAGGSRMVRGGAWVNLANDARSASRFAYVPDLILIYFGFRVARV